MFKKKNLILLFSVFIAFLCFSRVAYACTKFCTVEDQPLPQYNEMWKKLKNFYGSSMPSKITVRYVDRKGGTFSVPNRMINVNRTTPDYIVAHEACHVALGLLTNGVSNTEKFRFIDEGWASIVGTWFNGYEVKYKDSSLEFARKELQEGRASFNVMEHWTNYFGPWQRAPKGAEKRKHEVYQTASSVVYFLIDTYGLKKLKRFFKEMGKTDDLNTSFEKVYHRSASQMEAEWHSYVKASKSSA